MMKNKINKEYLMLLADKVNSINYKIDSKLNTILLAAKKRAKTGNYCLIVTLNWEENIEEIYHGVINKLKDLGFNVVEDKDALYKFTMYWNGINHVK